MLDTYLHSDQQSRNTLFSIVYKKIGCVNIVGSTLVLPTVYHEITVYSAADIRNTGMRKV
jgi:hypothetical protein